MAQTNIEQQDCPCRLVHSDSHDPIADCPECGGTGTVDVGALGPHLLAPDDDDDDDDGWQTELAEINAELDYFADDEAV